MAIALDQALGVNNLDTNSTTVTLTTTATVASGGFIVFCCGWFLETTTLSTVGGGGLTWAIDRQGVNTTAANDSVAIASAQAPSGLATSTVITCTFSGATQAKTIGAASFTGVKTSSALDTTSGPVSATTTAWTTGSVAISAGSLLVGTCWNEGAVASSTVTSPSTKLWDRFDVGDAYAQVVGYRVEASAGSYAIDGTWNASGPPHTTISAAYLEAPSWVPEQDSPRTLRTIAAPRF